MTERKNHEPSPEGKKDAPRELEELIKKKPDSKQTAAQGYIPQRPSQKVPQKISKEEPKESDEIKKDAAYIERAEDIIDKYENDPHEEEEKAASLQVEYLKKFGRDIKKSED